MKSSLLAALITSALTMQPAIASTININTAGQVCVADKKGVCNMEYQPQTTRYVENHITIHGDIEQMCVADSGGKCNMGGKIYRAKVQCQAFTDGFVTCD